MLTREPLRANGRVVAAVELAGMDIVEVSPPYDQAEVAAAAANRCALEAIFCPGRQEGGRPRGAVPAVRATRGETVAGPCALRTA